MFVRTYQQSVRGGFSAATSGLTRPEPAEIIAVDLDDHQPATAKKLGAECFHVREQRRLSDTYSVCPGLYRGHWRDESGADQCIHGTVA